jgi:hypothetical protein
MNCKHILLGLALLGGLMVSPCFGQSTTAPSISLASHTAGTGTYDYDLLSPASGVSFSPGNANNVVIVLSGLQGVTGATLSGALAGTGSNGMCGLSVHSFNSTSVNISNSGFNFSCAFSPNQTIGTLEVTSTVTTAGTVNWTMENAPNPIAPFTGTTQGPVQTVLTVNIIIKPGDTQPATINARSNGRIPVAILSDATFSAPGSVDQTTLTFGETGNEKSFASCSEPVDVNGDGFLDLVCNFFTQQTGFTDTNTTGTLKGKTKGGMLLQGSGPVRIIH